MSTDGPEFSKFRRPELVRRFERAVHDLKTQSEIQHSHDQQRRGLLELLKKHSANPDLARDQDFIQRLCGFNRAPEGTTWAIALRGESTAYHVRLEGRETVIAGKVHSEDHQYWLGGKSIWPSEDGRLFLAFDEKGSEGYILAGLNDFFGVSDLMEYIHLVDPSTFNNPGDAPATESPLGGISSTVVMSTLAELPPGGGYL